MKKFDDVAKGRDNNFNLIRTLAASAVLLSHSWPIADPTLIEPLIRETNQSLGGFAVIAFFAISGFFITKSFDRKSSLGDFIAARLFRIYPALVVVVTLSVFVLGLGLTSLTAGEYLVDPGTYAYLIRNSILITGVEYRLPGLFNEEPINGSLWTLPWELMCYVMVAVFGLARINRTDKYWIVIVTSIMVLILGTILDRGTGISRLFTGFFAGGAIYIYRDRVPFSFVIVAIASVATLVSLGTELFVPISIFTIAYGVLWLGYADIPLFRSFNRFSDVSYGLYVYAYPVQMTCVNVFGLVDPLMLAAVSLPITIVLAALSWRLVEEPALRRRHTLVARRKQSRPGTY